MKKVKKVKNTWYDKLFRLLNLETTTPSGRINLAGTVVLAVFCLLYTAQDTINYMISSTEATIKTIKLGVNIPNTYQSTEVSRIIVPILIGFLSCLIFLAFNDKKVQKIASDESKEVKNPMDNI